MALFRQVFWCFVMELLLVSSTNADEPIPKANPLADWTVTGKQLRKSTAGKTRLNGPNQHRLICEPQSKNFSQGSPIRLFLGVENTTSSGDSLLNPFTKESFPRNLRVALFDEHDQFLQWISTDNGQFPESDDSDCAIELHRGEYRGRFVEISTCHADPTKGAFCAPLKAGVYKLQMLACGKFFLGEVFRKEAEKSGASQSQRPIEDRWRILAELEVSRSEIATIQIVAEPLAPPVPDEPGEHAILQSIVDVEEVIDKDLRRIYGKVQIRHTLKNLSKWDSMGLIDPFYRLQKQNDQPIRWNLRETSGRFNRDLSKPAIGGGPGPYPSLFVIIPPQGVMSCPFFLHVHEKGEYEVSVDLLKGVVTDWEKIAILQSGNPQTGYGLGGVDPSVIHPDSILKRKFTVP